MDTPISYTEQYFNPFSVPPLTEKGLKEGETDLQI